MSRLHTNSQGRSTPCAVGVKWRSRVGGGIRPEAMQLIPMQTVYLEEESSASSTWSKTCRRSCRIGRGVRTRPSAIRVATATRAPAAKSCRAHQSRPASLHDWS